MRAPHRVAREVGRQLGFGEEPRAAHSASPRPTSGWITQGGAVVDPSTTKGPIRLARPR
ncbi:DUF3253 domain-containing protein [Cryobacterium cheniae]|uniref:DUF3253 domain-containing protein n=1 Tax=Cryobacterium cheniae TaxID=1259262 RepID=UPI003B96E134